MRDLLALFCITVLLSGCIGSRQLTYFSNSNLTDVALESSYEPVIMIDEDLIVDISATDNNAVEIFRSAGNHFLVDNEGNITLPILGKFHVAGLTEKEVTDRLTALLATQVKQPIVRVMIAEMHITILGEVTMPGQYKIGRSVTLLEALGLANDITSNGRRDNVLVIRNEGNSVKRYRISLFNDDVFKSPCYFMQNGDVIYISPQHSKSIWK